MQHLGRRCDHKDLFEHPENNINLGRFQPKENEVERQRGFTEEPCHYTCLCVHLRLSLSLLPICTFSVINGKEKKQIIFLYISIVVFLCYTTFYSMENTQLNCIHWLFKWFQLEPILLDQVISLLSEYFLQQTNASFQQLFKNFTMDQTISRMFSTRI